MANFSSLWPNGITDGAKKWPDLRTTFSIGADQLLLNGPNMKIKTVLALAITLSPLATAEEKQEPLETMSRCLIMHNWTAWGLWQLDVYALAGDKILIGDKENHFLVTASEPGYRHVISGEVATHYPEATSLSDLGSACKKNCPTNHRKRTGWFKRRCKSYSA
ncbi:hypothetical protein [Microbulbifer taiwanensis]|uniref:hypothetical protein n=1 Tax=Microbulbifer taiwanensis TaxID=986746 RepID=UPI0036135694